MPHHTFRTVASRAVALLLLTAGTAAAQSRSVAGTYNATIESPQGAIKVVMVVKKTGASYGGTLAAEGFQTIPISTVTPSDTLVQLSADSPDGPVLVKLRWSGASAVTGSLNYQGMEMPLNGTYAGEGAAGGSAAGTYAFETEGPMLGMPKLAARCVVQAGVNGAWTGSCGNAEIGDVPVTSVESAGGVITIGGDSPNGPYKIVMTMVGTTFTGTATVGPESSKLKGTFTAAR